jgi:hypothetical protein
MHSRTYYSHAKYGPKVGEEEFLLHPQTGMKDDWGQQIPTHKGKIFIMSFDYKSST